MLCDLRDLAKCAQACRRWYGIAQKLLYTSVRIDAVHYCALEEQLAEKRKKATKHFRGKSAVEPVDVPNIRLELLCRTVRQQAHLADRVLFLKLPYMTRETAKGDLARTVSALPNLRYVDLPDGFFSGDPSCLALRQELQARCPDIRKMSYRGGAEDALELLAQGHWQHVEILELSALAIEPTTLRIVLASLPTLQQLTLSDLDWMDDQIFLPSPGQLPDFPALQALKLVSTPNVTAKGLKHYLDYDPKNRERLISLTLQTTSVTVVELPQVLWSASSLQHLSITETVMKSLSLAIGTQDFPPLASISLRTLHFEITSSEDVHGLQRPAESYYAYLASSLHQNTLPALTTLYVRDPHFADLLLIPPMSMAGMPPLPRPSFATSKSENYLSNRSLKSTLSNLSSAANSNQAPSTEDFQPYDIGNGNGNRTSMFPIRGTGGGGGFTQTLEVFSKGIDELEWVFTSISPPPTTATNFRTRHNSTGGRPLSAYSASRGLGPQWAQGGFGGEARKSVIVGNGFGGFLAIPREEAPRPLTADGGKRWGSVGSSGSAESDGDEVLKPPPSISSLAGSGPARERRGSRHDLWR